MRLYLILIGLAATLVAPGWAAGHTKVIHAPAGGGVVVGHQHRDIIYGSPFRDIIRARAGSDVVYAGAGRDVVYGHRGGDMLRGQQGGDRIHGGIGHNRISGGWGADRITTRSRFPEIIRCGPGEDSATSLANPPWVMFLFCEDAY